MINDKDIEKLKGVFATKQDLENLIEIVATKEDLKNFATKQDLENFATKQDLEGFATKEDFGGIKEIVDEILDGQDDIMGKLELLLEEKTIGNDQNKRQKKVLQIHHNALKTKKILSEKEVLEINKLEVF